jgi:L-malate glycosyltransferase
MKINFIVPQIVRSGGFRVIFEYANRLSLRGHDVILFTPLIPFNPYRPSIKLDFLQHQLKYFLKQITGKPYLPVNIFEHNFKIKVIPSINNLYIRNADALIATSWTTSFHVNALNEKKGRKFYLIQDYEVWNSNKKRADKSYILPLEKIVISKYLQDLLKEKFNVESCKIPVGINFEKFYNNDKVFKQPLNILFSDHQLENKNVEGAINIVEQLKQKYPSITFSCFGIEKSHKMPNYIIFHENPNDDELRQIYCTADIFLFTSKYEGYGLPPFEAMACKCAVAANAVAAIPEFVKHLESAMLADSDNPRELFDCACYLIDNPDELRRISLNGCEVARILLDWEKIIDKFEKLLKRTV